MKAVICTNYGPPEVLQIQEVAKPIPKDTEVLVKIMATAVNSGDVRVRSLDVKGFLRVVMRLVIGIRRPRKPILGTVFSGVIERVGSQVSTFKTGDRVFGMTGFSFGTYAEYLAVKQNANILHMPANASFEDAAAIIFGGQTAIHYLHKAGIASMANPKVLIIGATGAVGSAAVQIAASYHADVTAVCSTAGQPLMHDLGVNKTVLYDQQDLSQLQEKYDIIFDAVGKSTKGQCKNLLKEYGVYKTVSAGYASESQEQLQLLKDLFEKGELKSAIDKIYRMDEIVEAHRYVDTGRKKGNVVLRMVE